MLMRFNTICDVTFRLTFSSLSGSPLQRVFRETLKDFHTGLRLFMTVWKKQSKAEQCARK